jgi:hypothetical protein
VLHLALEKATCKPKVFFKASSTATIYEHFENSANTEKCGLTGDNFSKNLAKSWEREFLCDTKTETRKVAICTSIVLGTGRGAFHKLKAITKLGLGVKQGSENQMVSWIHVDDFCRRWLF